MLFPLYITQFEVAFVDPGTDCVKWQWFSKALVTSRCLYLSQQHEGSLGSGACGLTHVQQWFAEMHPNKRQMLLLSHPLMPLVDCRWSSWSQWSPCSASCGSGQQSSSRFVLQPSRYGGAPCEGPDRRTATCIAPDCGECEKQRWILFYLLLLALIFATILFSVEVEWQSKFSLLLSPPVHFSLLNNHKMLSTFPSISTLSSSCCIICPRISSPPPVQCVLTGSAGGGPHQRRSRCVRGAARTFTPPPPSAAATPPRAACVGRGCTETQRACVSSLPSALAMTRALCGRCVHVHVRACTKSRATSAARQIWHLVPFVSASLPISAVFTCNPIVLFTHKEGPIRRWVTSSTGHITLQCPSSPQPHQLCRKSALGLQLGKPARNYLWRSGY